MPDILHEVIISATPDNVFQAITEQDGLAAWWTTHISAESKVGSVIEASFLIGGDLLVHRLEVVTLEPDRRVEWVVRQGGYPDWNGTRLTWDLTQTETGTKILFGHRGFPSAEGSFPKVNKGWTIYLSSLQNYLETGEGHPHSY